MSALVSFARFPPRRGGSVRARSWWGKAWVRALEENALEPPDLKRGRSLARSGRLGAITVAPGTAVAVAEDPSGLVRTPRVDLVTLDERAWSVFLDELAGRSGHTAALLAGELPHRLMEEVEDAGVELLPYGSEIEPRCDCGSWVQPCVHTIGLMYQLGWLVDEDPFVLFLLRGRSRQELLDGLNRRFDEPGGAAVPEATHPSSPWEGDAIVADAAARAREILALAADAPVGDGLADSRVAAYDLEVDRLVSPGE